jgi:putative Mg2+ transporter-C (MgtC) family protein
MMSDIELMERLLLAAALGALLGFEREWRQKNAGLRTNILIAMGAALFTLMSIDLSASAGGDATRVASQIVTGIGFIGAGAIMRTRDGIRGLTTAAMIWVNAAIGVAVGGGEYRLAIIATAVTLLVLVLMNPLERFIDKYSKNRPASDDDPPSGGLAEESSAPAVESTGGQPRPRRQ